MTVDMEANVNFCAGVKNVDVDCDHLSNTVEAKARQWSEDNIQRPIREAICRRRHLSDDLPALQEVALAAIDDVSGGPGGHRRLEAHLAEAQTPDEVEKRQQEVLAKAFARADQRLREKLAAELVQDEQSRQSQRRLSGGRPNVINSAVACQAWAAATDGMTWRGSGSSFATKGCYFYDETSTSYANTVWFGTGGTTSSMSSGVSAPKHRPNEMNSASARTRWAYVSSDLGSSSRRTRA